MWGDEPGAEIRPAARLLSVADDQELAPPQQRREGGHIGLGGLIENDEIENANLAVKGVVAGSRWRGVG